MKDGMAPRMRTGATRRVLHLGVALLVLLLVPVALAQGQEEACREPDLTVTDTPPPWPPGSSWTYELVVANPNEVPVESVSARLLVSAPPGWSAVLSQSSLVLSEGDAPSVAITVTAPQRGTGVPTGDVEVTVQFTCHRASTNEHADAVVTLPVVLEGVRVPWPLVGAGLLAGALGGGVAWTVSARRGNLGLASDDDDKPVVPGDAVQFPITVVNRSRNPDTVALAVADVPEGWTAHVAVAHLELEPREGRALWVLVRAPADARYGDEVALDVTARSRVAPRDAVRLRLTARVRREA